MTPLNRQIGTSLIELLISTLITAIGLLGLSKIQVNSLVNSQQSYHSTAVTWQLYQIAERMRANTAAANNGNYLGNGADNDCLTTACSSQQMAQFDIFNWNLDNAAFFPSGQGTITQPGGTGADYLITVRWDGNRNGATGTGCDVTDNTDLLCNTLTVTIN